jgi:hypothetical protein
MLKNAARSSDKKEGRGTQFLGDRPLVDADA